MHRTLIFSAVEIRTSGMVLSKSPRLPAWFAQRLYVCCCKAFEYSMGARLGRPGEERACNADNLTTYRELAGHICSPPQS